ncbi:M56 family metallopeptidase [Hymenobacter antarcticus]|uniref:Peptidase M56 domain-containing protein n=1 Tax=Hymenobacter antarcticus TaxID=486270 RepID=A0ABP7QGV9_9BACT
MTTLEHFVSPVLVRALGWTLLHSLWQGALVAAVLAGALLLLRRQRAEVRYVASAGALGAVVALAGITFGLYFTAGAGLPAGPRATTAAGARVELGRPEARIVTTTTTAAMADATAPAGARPVTRQVAAPAPVAAPPAEGLLNSGLMHSFTQSLIHSLNNHLPLLVVAWLLGLLAMSLRMLGGLLYVQRLRRYRVRPLSAAWQERLAVLAARSGLRRPVALLESALVRVPLVVGHMRPVILLPLGAVAGLSAAHLEAILAHELAHVLRRDYLVNLLQTVAEALFFYHPAVWFMASCVRAERENCCDDTATALVGGDPLRLARALTALAEWSQSAVVPTAPRLALAAMGRRGALLSRVRRLVQRRPAAPTLAEGIMASALVLGGLGLLGGSVALAGSLTQPAVPAAKPAAFDWQTGPAKAGGLADINKRAATTATSTTTATQAAPPAPAQPGEESREVTILQDGPDDAAPRPPRPPRQPRESRRVIINGREMAPPPFPGNSGTVVITKDKKGRLTDLVVNGQRVEAATGKSKKTRGDKNQQVEIIQVVPPGNREFRGYAFRNDGGMERRLEGQVEREVERSKDFRFDFPAFDERQFRMAPEGQLNRTYRLQRLDGSSGGDERRARLEGLRGAERGLRTAAAVKSLNAQQRKDINKELEKVRVRIRQAESALSSSQPRLPDADGRQRKLDGRVESRDRQQESQDQRQAMRDRQQELQDQRQELQDRQQEMRDRQQEQRDLAQERTDRDRADRDQERADRDRYQHEALVAELRKDGLIQDQDNFQLKLTGTSMTVNGKEQPAQVRQKYLKLYEGSTGRKMSATGAMNITRNGTTSFSRNDAPRPPRPPRAPRAPIAPMMEPPVPPMPPMPAMPALPAPPTPPRVDTETLRKELRKDGVLGSDEKNLQFQLNSSGLTVNGKKQSDALAAKYRKLTSHDNGKNFNMTISTQE